MAVASDPVSAAGELVSMLNEGVWGERVGERERGRGRERETEEAAKRRLGQRKGISIAIARQVQVSSSAWVVVRPERTRPWGSMVG